MRDWVRKNSGVALARKRFVSKKLSLFVIATSTYLDVYTFGRTSPEMLLNRWLRAGEGA